MDGGRPVFQALAGAYDLATRQPYWDEAVGRLLESAGTLPPAPRVLDLGCGPGVSAFALARRLGPGARVTGVDVAPAMVERARRHHRRSHAGLEGLDFAVADGAALPFPDGSFDLATGHSFLYIVPDAPSVLREALRVLAPGGTLALMEPDAEGTLWGAAWRARRQAGHLLLHPWDAGRFAASMVTWRAYSLGRGQWRRGEVADLLREAGFVDVAVRPALAGLGVHVTARTPAGARPGPGHRAGTGRAGP